MKVMKFVHYPLNPSGAGIDKVADVYVAKEFDPNMEVAFSEQFRKLLSEAKLSKELKRLLDEAV
jgi:hypothetical protein